MEGLVIPDTASDYSLCSAVITAELSVRRTEKVLIALVAGLPILPREYIEQSFARHAFLSPSTWRIKRGQEGVEGDLADVLLRAGDRWRVKRPFKGWRVAIKDTSRARMLLNVLRMGEGEDVGADDDEVTMALVGDGEASKGDTLAWLKRLWAQGVSVYRSDFLLDYVCYSERRDWDAGEYQVTKDTWQQPFVNPMKERADTNGGSSQATSTTGADTEGEGKRGRKRS